MQKQTHFMLGIVEVFGDGGFVEALGPPLIRRSWFSHRSHRENRARHLSHFASTPLRSASAASRSRQREKGHIEQTHEKEKQSH